MRGASGDPVSFIGFDAGSPTLVRRWVADGHLPNFAHILAQGATATVEHEPGLYVGSVWPTTLTGVGVSRHGFYTGIRPAPFSYHYIAEAPLVDPFWVDVGQTGRRIWVADAPFFAARPGLDGVQLVEWGCHDRYFGPHSEPPEALEVVVRDVGRHPLGMIDHDLGYDRFAPCDWVHLTDGRRTRDDVRAYIATVDDAVDRRMRLIDQRAAMGPFDLTIDIVAETHCGGHHLWSLHDESHVDHDHRLRAELGQDPLLAVYQRMDDLLGSHLATVGDGVSYVFLSHGMQAHHDGTHLFDEVLWRLDQAYRGEPTPWVGPATDRAHDVLQRLPASARARALSAAGPLLRRRLRGPAEAPTPRVVPPPPSERLWYPLDNNTVSGAVRFNRIGREPQGLLGEPMTHHAARWLERELGLIMNLDHGGPVISSVYASDTLYERRDDDGLPDLLVDWVRDHPIDRVWSPTIGLISRPYDGIRTGDHEGTGELVVTGRGIAPGRVGEIRPTDIAPTVAAAAGVFLSDRDGEPIAQLLPGGSASSRGTHRALVTLRSSPHTAVHESQQDAADLRHELIEMRRSVRSLAAAHHETRTIAVAASAAADTATEVVATTSWIRGETVPEDLLVSVVMPTCGRLDRLERAVGSVLAQSHRRLELVVVDDATDDGTSAWLAGHEDPRLIVVRNRERLGEGGSRNRGLDVVSGDVVTFLDDDNRFDPDWLRSVAWLFSSQPDTRVAYGARIVDDVDRHHRRGEGGMPWLQLNGWDRTLMRVRCLVDMNTVAHRRGDVRFDPELVVFTDWDYLLGLTLEADPIRFPVVAAHYTTDAPSRVSMIDEQQEREMYERVRTRWAAAT